MVRSRPGSTSSVSSQRALRVSTWHTAICTLFTIALAAEVRTSRLQSFILARYAAQLTYDIGPGPSSRIVFPSSGPHDQQLGYTHLPEFTRRLLSRGFGTVSYTHLRAHETPEHLVCR